MTYLIGSVTKVLTHISHHTSLYVIGAAIVAMFVPNTFCWVVGTTQTIVLGIIMLTMGLTLTVDDFKILASRPLDIIIGTIAQFSIMPLVAFSIAKSFGLDDSMALGIILVGCCPGGVSSNIMSYLCHGDVAFSVGMTTVSTLIAPIMTPFLVLMLAGQTIEVDAVGMFINILIVTIFPITIGFALNYFYSRNESFIKVRQLMPGLSVSCLACIVGGVVFSVHDNLIQNGLNIFLFTFAMVLIHNTIGYALGYSVGTIFKFTTAKKRTVSIEIGMQNAGLATNLASTFFLATNPLALLPCAISCAWHSISGTLLAQWFAKHDAK